MTLMLFYIKRGGHSHSFVKQPGACTTQDGANGEGYHIPNSSL